MDLRNPWIALREAWICALHDDPWIVHSIRGLRNSLCAKYRFVSDPRLSPRLLWICIAVDLHSYGYTTALAKWQAMAPPSRHACAIPGLRNCGSFRGWLAQSTDPRFAQGNPRVAQIHALRPTYISKENESDVRLKK